MNYLNHFLWYHFIILLIFQILKSVIETMCQNPRKRSVRLGSSVNITKGCTANIWLSRLTQLPLLTFSRAETFDELRKRFCVLKNQTFKMPTLFTKRNVVEWVKRLLLWFVICNAYLHTLIFIIKRLFFFLITHKWIII